MSDSLSLKCRKCGSSQFQVPSNPTSTSIVTCAGCGATNTYGALQKQALAEGKKAVKKVFKEALKKWK